MTTTTIEQRLERLERLFVLAVHSFNGPDQKMEPAEYARFRWLLHELRSDVSHRGEHRSIEPL